MPAVSTLTIEYWDLNKNTTPVFEFISEVEPDEARAKIMSTIKLLESLGMGLLTNPNIFKKIQGHNHLYELRVRFGKVAYRILVVVCKKVAYLVHAFRKQRNNELKQIRLGLRRRDIILAANLIN